MLSRTADHLFWMSRYTERAENTARMLDVNYQTALLPQSAAVAQVGWQGLLVHQRAGHARLQQEVRPGNHARATCMDFMVRDESNPSSIATCLKAARENARAVRGALTTELWETQNQTWLELGRMLKSKNFERDPSEFFEWVKFRSHLSRGVAIGTMLQDEAFHFYRMGTFLERADNTARLLDVKFHAVHSDFFGAASELDQEYDFYHWSAILRSVSGFEVYRKVYRDVISPERVAELLILRADMPRSLAASVGEVVNNLSVVANDHSSRDPASGRQAEGRPAVRPYRRDPGHRPACLPHAVPRPGERTGWTHQQGLSGAGGLKGPDRKEKASFVLAFSFACVAVVSCPVICDAGRSFFRATFEFALQTFQLSLVLFVGLQSFLRFSALIEMCVLGARQTLHLLMGNGPCVREHRETVGADDLVHVLSPEDHASLLSALGPKFGCLQEDDHQTVQGINLVLGQVVLGDQDVLLAHLATFQCNKPKLRSLRLARAVMSSAAVFRVTA